MSDNIEVYTDGGCSGNPGPGGWAFVIIGGEDSRRAVVAEKWGAERNTTNNRMELLAVISALDALAAPPRKTGKLTVYTDSQYVQKGMTLWLAAWKANGWKTSGRAPVKNRDLWQRLDALAEGFEVTWAWVKGHAGNEYNERCDTLTQKAIASLSVS